MLLIDIGNTRVKWCLFENGKLFNHHAIVHKDLSPETALEQLPLAKLTWISNVAGQKFLDALQKSNVHFAVSCKELAGVKNGYKQPEELGVDRWLALIAAFQTTQSAVCVVDLGSAVTLDVIDKNGQHLGGHILAGWPLLSSAFSLSLPHIDFPKTLSGAPRSLSKSTEDGIKSGYLTSMIAYLEAMAHLYPMILTGGDAPALLPHLNFPVVHRPHLVLEGLACYAQPCSVNTD